jgi:hypothetical protein
VTEAFEVTIGRAGADHVTVRVLGLMYPGSDDHEDSDWLVSPITARAGMFSAEVGAGLRIVELRTFRRGLERMDRELAGAAVLESIEGWVSLTVTCLPDGALEVTGVLRDEPLRGNRLSFAISGLDQSDIPPMVEALAAIEKAYPIRRP